MKNLSCHTDLFELVTSLLIMRIQMGERSKLGWLIRLVKHAIWADSLYFLYLLLLSIPTLLVPHSYRSACFTNGVSATLTGNAIDTLCHLLRISFWPSFCEWTRVCLLLKIVVMLYRFSICLNFSETPFTYWIYTEPRCFYFAWATAALGINNRVSETLEITIKLKICTGRSAKWTHSHPKKLKITSQATDFITHTLVLLACGEAPLWRLWIKPLFTYSRWLELKLRYCPVWMGFL
jgi:hypothetical protein